MGNLQNNKNEIPDGIYICKINNIEYKKSKNNKDMITVIFEVSDEESNYYKNRIYMNQVIDTAFGKHLANEFLRSLGTGIEVEYTNIEELNIVLDSIKEKLKLMEFDVKQVTKNIFKSFYITGIYDLIEI